MHEEDLDLSVEPSEGDIVEYDPFLEAFAKLVEVVFKGVAWVVLIVFFAMVFKCGRH